MIQLKTNALKYIQTRKIKAITDKEVVQVLSDYIQEGYTSGTEVNLGYRNIRNDKGNKSLIGYLYYDLETDVVALPFTRSVQVVQWKKLEYYMRELGYDYNVNPVTGAKTQGTDKLFNNIENILFQILCTKKEKLYIVLNITVSEEMTKIVKLLDILVDLQAIQNVIITTDNIQFFKDLGKKDIQT